MPSHSRCQTPARIRTRAGYATRSSPLFVTTWRGPLPFARSQGRHRPLPDRANARWQVASPSSVGVTRDPILARHPLQCQETATGTREYLCKSLLKDAHSPQILGSGQGLNVGGRSGDLPPARGGDRDAHGARRIARLVDRSIVPFDGNDIRADQVKDVLNGNAHSKQRSRCA